MSTFQYLVVGANRGIGLEFVRQLLQKPSNKVVATYRDASKIDDLKRLLSEKANAGRLELVRLDMNDDASCKAAAEEVKSKVKALDVLILNAGAVSFQDTSVLKQSTQDISKAFENNVLGPIRVAQHFAHLIQDSSISPIHASAKLILISSLAGSIADGKTQIGPAYSISKAAMNMTGRKLSEELKPSKVAVALVHPGWVQTDMGGSDAPLTPAESVGGMLKVMDQVGMHNSGEFWQWDGHRLLW